MRRTSPAEPHETVSVPSNINIPVRRSSRARRRLVPRTLAALIDDLDGAERQGCALVLEHLELTVELGWQPGVVVVEERDERAAGQLALPGYARPRAPLDPVARR